MHTVIVTFSLRGIDHEAFVEATAGIAPAFADVPGLHAKLWLADAASDAYGGVYLFEDAEAAGEYLASDLFDQAVVTNPLFGDLAVRRADVLNAPTAITAPALRPVLR